MFFRLRQLQVFEHWRIEVHGAIILSVMTLRPQGLLAYQQATLLNPTDPQAYNHLGPAYHQQKRYSQAITAYEQAIARNANYALAYANLGASYEALGKASDAQAAYHQAWQRDSNLEFARQKMDTLRQHKGAAR